MVPLEELQSSTLSRPLRYQCHLFSLDKNRETGTAGNLGSRCHQRDLMNRPRIK